MITLIARQNFEIIDFFGNSYEIKQGEKLKGKFLGKSKKNGMDLYLIDLFGKSQAVYNGDFVKHFMKIEGE